MRHALLSASVRGGCRAASHAGGQQPELSRARIDEVVLSMRSLLPTACFKRSIHPWPVAVRAQGSAWVSAGLGFPPTARRVAMAWHAREPGTRKTLKNWRKGLRHSREEACITLLRIASRGVAAQPSKKKLFVLRPSSLVFVLVDLVVLRIHVRRITARGACSSEVAVDAAPLLLDRVVSIVPSSLSILHPRRTSSRQPP